MASEYELGGLSSIPNALGENFLTLPTEEVSHDSRFEIRSDWRIERRNDRKPVGYAIFKRGKPVYIGYVGFHSKPKDGFPTYEEISSRG
jgi:hypothetical protein